MKTLKLFLCFSLLVLHSFFAMGQSWDWGKEGSSGAAGNSSGSSVAIDMNGNAYITGSFRGITVFGSFNLNSTADGDAYLVKYDPSGNVIWALQAKDSLGYSDSWGSSVAVDKSGNIYMAGTFEYWVSFQNYTLHTNQLNTDCPFLVKYNSSGNVIWAKQGIVPANSIYVLSDEPSSVTTDKDGNVLITGYFNDSVTFGADTLSTFGGNYTPFLVKYDSSGNVLWARQSNLPTSSCGGFGTSVTTDNTGNIYVTGYFYDALFWGSYHLVISTSYAAYTVKYSASGNILWAKQSEDINIATSTAYSTSVVTDQARNVYMSGYFYDSIKFDSHILYSLYISSTDYNSGFLVKYDSNGNVIWAEQSSLGLSATSLACDGTNHIYMAGITNLPDSIYSFGGYVLHAIPWADGNSYLLKFDTSGAAVCGSILENLENGNEPASIAADSINSSQIFIYMSGGFGSDTVLCGPDVLIGGLSNVFIGRWFDCAQDAGINELKGESGELKVFPNPFTTFTNISISGYGKYYLELDDIIGRKLRYIEFTGTQYELSADGLAKGLYFIRVFGRSPTGDYNNCIGTTKIVVQ
jgi:hypothetical protein